MTRFRVPSPLISLVVVLCVGLLMSAIPAWGQAVSTGTVVGVVADPSGAVIPGATVTLTDIATHDTRTTVTNDTGRYVFVNVTPGTYDITANKKGFAVARVPAQKVSVGLQTNVNLQLPLGAATQTVEVQAGVTELQTMNSTVGNTVTGVALSSLPSLGRDVSTFVTLQPGVSPDGSVAGAVVDQSSFMLDGGNNTNDMDGSMTVYTPSFAGDPTGGVIQKNADNIAAFVGPAPTGVMPTPADSVEEFKVATANQTADFNNSSGMQVSVVTKRGTDAWHGTGYEYYLDNNFSANTWDNKLTHTPVPDYHYSRFGVAAGGPILPKFLGGKTYFFANYQGFRWPNSQTFERAVPSADMRNGFLTFGGTRFDLKALDPRGIGINPLVQQLWNKFLPPGNDPSCGALVGSKCDGVNEIGFKANLSIPQSDNFGVARLDHDFGSKWHFMSSYRYYNLKRAVNNQVDIGGFFSGDQLGVPASVANRPQVPWYLVAGLTTNISSNTTNDFHYSFLRNWWARLSNGGPAQFPGLGAALEPFGESRTTALLPYNVDTQNVRTRVWDGKDHFFRDDVSMLKGSHLLQFGGQYQHNFDFHNRTDNGGGINFFPTYLLGDSLGAGLVDMSAIAIPGITSSTKIARDTAAVLGIVTDSQQAFTRSGANLALNPPLTPAFDQSTIPYYNVYFSDTWHMRPTFTLTYGLGWTLEMPPHEKNGKQVELIDSSAQPIDIQAYLKQREAAALKGQVFNPVVGFALVGNTANGLKYPYNPFYGAFSPRLAAAWNITKSTVIRAGYGRIYGRLNGVDLVLVPLLGTGLIQPVTCQRALASGACGPAKPSVGAQTDFRIGTNGLTAPLPAASPTLPQPLFPGINDVAAGAGEALDPHFRPNSVDSYDLTIQHQLTRSVVVEAGLISRWIRHEYQPININAVPHMMTLGGQSFAQAYAAVEKAMGCATSITACSAATVASTLTKLAPQPFFEAALANTGYCAAGTCTATVVANEFGNFQSQAVVDLWSDLDNGGIGGGPNGTTVPGWNFPRSMLNSPLATPLGSNGQIAGGVGVNASIGHGNYNAGFFSLRMDSWHGLTMQHNFTYSKALGTGAFVQATSEYTAADPFNLNNSYGAQAYDRRFVYTSFFVYQPPIFKGQQGLLGRALGGWSIAPMFAAGSGAPLPCNTQTGDFGDLGFPGGQEFGAGSSSFFGNEANCIFTNNPTGSASPHFSVNGSNGIGTATAGTGGAAVNIFANPEAAWNTVRPPILGIDNKSGGFGRLYGLPYWNLDLSVKKNFRITERFSTEAQVVFTNVLNHNVFLDPAPLDLTSPSTWGVITTQGNNPRTMEFGIRLNF